MLSMKSIAALAAIFVLSALSASCGGGSTVMNSNIQNQPGADLPQFGTAAGLPGLAELERDLSEVSAQRSRTGSEFLSSLSSGDNVSIFGDSCDLEPTYMDSWRLSYAGWRFWLPDYSEQPSVSIYLDPEMLASEDSLYLGLSNWELGSWSWYAVPQSGQVELGDLAPMIHDQSSALYAVVLSDGEDTFRVDRLRIGGSQLPTARLTSDFYLVAPLDPVILNAKHSEFFAAPWSKTEIAPEGDGNWIDTLGASTLGHAYGSPGLYKAGLRVTDTDGNEVYDYVTIAVSDSAYFEVEDNDTLETAQGLPKSSFSGLSGNIGAAGAHADGIDWYSFSLEQACAFRAETMMLGSDEFVFLELYRQEAGQEPELVKRSSRKVNHEITETLTPGNYLLAMYDYKDSVTMDKDYELAVDFSYSEPPVIEIDPYTMTSAFDANLNISIDNSYDPDGTLIQWEIDLYGDGHFEVFSPADGLFSFPGNKRSGSFMAAARITDNAGLTTEKRFPLSIVGDMPSNFTEVEPNNSPQISEPLPGFDFTLLRGDISADPVKSDYADYFPFSTESEGQFSFDLDILNEESGDVRMTLSRRIGDEWIDEEVYPGGGDTTMLSAPGLPAGEYYLLVQVNYGSTQYDLSGSFTPAP